MKQIQLTAALVMTLFGNFVYSPPIKAQFSINSSNLIKFVPPPPPPDRSSAGNRGGAASRGCGNVSQSLMGLVPDYQQTINLEGGDKIPVTKIWGLTTAEFPTFWFVFPYDQSSITNIEFVLKDESQKPSKTIYRTLLNKPEKPGIIGISTKEATKPLEINQTARWYFKVRVKCDSEQPAQLQTVDGWVKRVSPDSNLVKGLQKATPLQQAALYAQNGLWHNALTVLAELRLTKPTDASLKANWTSLLKSEELDKFADYPLINCCQPQQSHSTQRF